MFVNKKDQNFWEIINFTNDEAAIAGDCILGDWLG